MDITPVCMLEMIDERVITGEDAWGVRYIHTCCLLSQTLALNCHY